MRAFTWLSRVYVYLFQRSAKARTGDAATTAHAYTTSYAHHTSCPSCWFCYLKTNKPPSFLWCANRICNKTSHRHKDVQNRRQNSYFLHQHWIRLGVGSHLQEGLWLLAGKVCVLGTGKAGWGQGPSALYLQTGQHQHLCPAPLQQMPFCICPGNSSHCHADFLMPLFKTQIIKSI